MYASDPAPLSSERTVVEPRSPTDRSPDPLVDAVGSTPLVPLFRLGSRPDLRGELWGKAEYLNPSGSVKDRAAWGIVRTALDDGRLGPGRTLVDASSGNTGVAFAFLGARLGFPVELYVPRTVAPERLARMRAFGARVVLTDPSDGTDGAQLAAQARARESPERLFYADQYNNPANPRAHYETTGPELWAQSRGRITHLVAGVGTGGTISGAGRFLKERRPSIRIVGVEPTGPIHGLEGLKHLPTARRPSTYDEAVVDETIRIETDDALSIAHRLAVEEGVAVGPSSGAAVAGALRLRTRDPRTFIVAILPDEARPRSEGDR